MRPICVQLGTAGSFVLLTFDALLEGKKNTRSCCNFFLVFYVSSINDLVKTDVAYIQQKFTEHSCFSCHHIQ
jgi:hypothetical protein